VRLRPVAVAGPVNWSTANESRSALDHPGRRLTGVLVDNWGDLDRPPVHFRQFRISQKRLERGVFTLEVFEPLDPSAQPGFVARQPRRQSSGPAHRAFQGQVESKRYRRWKVCRTQGKQPISRGEYSPSRREQLGRQRLYPSVTI
jgi:hypothetical protein